MGTTNVLVAHGQAGYLPGLNGLRALAAGTVLYLHINDCLPSLGLPFMGRTDGGLYAVTVFFALSGFLITYLLLREKEKKGTVSITQFYLRRTLRIWPLYFVFLCLALLFNHFVSKESYDSGLIWYSVFFCVNIPNASNIFIPNASHLWSLSVEEQFYVSWPWLVRLARRPIYVLVAVLVLFTLVKAAFRFHYGGAATAYMFMYISRFDCMALGGIVAWWYWRGIGEGAKRWLHAWPLQLAAWAVLAATIPNWFHVFSFLDHFLVACATLVIILNLIGNPAPLFRLEGRGWRYLGGISFGIYMWHPLIVAGMALLLPYLPLPPLGKIAFLLVTVSLGTVLVADLSMRFLESPFLRLRKH